MGVSNKKIIEARGGGWYLLPNGDKVRGRSAAMAKASMLVNINDPTLAGRLRFLRQAGFQYRGLRDVYTTAGYVQEGSEKFDDYWAKYARDPVAGRIVDMPPKTTWRTPPEVFEGEAEKDEATEFENAWIELSKRLKVWRHFERVDRLSRIGRYAVLFIGTVGGDDQELKEPLESLSGPDDVLYLSSYDERYAVIKIWEQDPSSKRFGLPLLYEVQLSSGIDEFKAKKLIVHHSRLIHVAEDTLTDDVYGRPALKRALNALDDLLKITASTGEAYWQLASRILAAKIDSEADVPKKMMDEMGEALEEMIHDLRRQFVGQGVDLSWLTGEVPKPSDALEVYKQLMAVASGIPTRILFGSEQGQLASSQDERAYFGMINERQEQHAEPDILRAFIDRLVSVGGLPQHGVEGYTVVWPALYELSERDLADANLTRAKAAKELTPMGGDPLDLVEIDGNRNVWLRSSEDIEKRKAEKEELEAEEAEDEELEEEQPEEEDLEGLATEEMEQALEEATQRKIAVLAANQTQIQTLIFPKTHWSSVSAAKKWAKEHNFKSGSVDETSTSYRIRQKNPSAFKRMRVICLKGAKNAAEPACSVKAVVGPLK